MLSDKIEYVDDVCRAGGIIVTHVVKGLWMPSLSFFIDERDICLLLDRLNEDPEIAFIVPGGPPENRKAEARRGLTFVVENNELKAEVEPVRQWKAVRTVDSLADGLHSLWHVPAGSLPLIEVKKDPDPMPLIGPNSPPLYPPIPDPWSGWIGTDQFGPGCLPWVRLEVWTRHQPYTQDERATLQELNAFWTKNHELLVVSGFQWTGNHFRPAPPQTQRWWNRIRGWVDRNAVKLRSGVNFWAFPSALEKLKSGMRYYSRNFDLDDAIQHAENLDQRK